MILESVVAALVPVSVEAVKRFIDRKIGGIVPRTVDDEVKLQEAETARIAAISSLDTPSQWVIDLRASSRYVAALFVIAAGVVVFYVPGVTEGVLALAADAVGIVFGFLFGSRLVTRK
jgi:hypothetical protein